MRLSSRAKILARRALQRAGFDLVRALPPDDVLRRRIALIQRHRIDLLFDVGANAGQYVATMRALGYGGRIVSFEPSSEAFQILAQTARHDPGWAVVNCALGDRDGAVTLHISANSQSSSLLAMLPAHVAADPRSSFVADETVEMTTLAQQIEHHVRPGERLFVKIDTQGSEDQVVLGAGEQLSQVVGLQLELSMVPLYDGQPLIDDMISSLRGKGFVPMSLEPDFYDRTTGELLQADGIFFRAGGAEHQGLGEMP